MGVPAPRWVERVARLVGLRVLRLPGGRWWVLAGSVERVWDLMAVSPPGSRVRRVRLVVVCWRSPYPGWSGAVRGVAGVVRQRVVLPVRGRGPARVAVRMARPAPVREVLGAAASAVMPVRPVPASASAELTGLGVVPWFVSVQPGTTLVDGVLPASAEIRAHDIVLRPPAGHPALPDMGGATVNDEPAAPATGTDPAAPATGTDPAAPATGTDPAAPATGREGASTEGRGGVSPLCAVAFESGAHAVAGADAPVVLVDARRVNPRGRRASAYRDDAARARLELSTGARLRGDGLRTPRLLAGPGLDASVLGVLRETGVVDCPDLHHTNPADAVDVAALLVQLAMTGVLVHTPRLPGRVADLITPPLRKLITTPVDGLDPLGREARSVRQRRAAIRGHATGLVLPQLAAGTFPTLAAPPPVSAILATRRTEMLRTAVAAITAQTYPELEIIICLHGIPTPDWLPATLAATGRPHHIIGIDATTSFGEALGTATRAAAGTLITKFDDDDSYSTEHVWDLVLARHYSGATLVGKGSEFVHLEETAITVRRPSGTPEADGELVAGGTMLIARGDLETVGGWRPVPRSVDHGLIQRLHRDGAAIYRTHPLGYIYHRRTTGHTWNPDPHYFLTTAHTRWTGIPSDALADPSPEASAGEPATAGAGEAGAPTSVRSAPATR